MKDSRIWLGSAGKTPCSGVLCGHSGISCTSLLCAVLHGCAVWFVGLPCFLGGFAVRWSALLCCALGWERNEWKANPREKIYVGVLCRCNCVVLQPCCAALCAMCMQLGAGRALLCAAVLPVCSCALVCSAVCVALLCCALCCRALLCYVCVVFE